MSEFAKFGPGGNSEAFYAAGWKSSADAPAWLKSIGLNAYEYQAGNGLTAGPKALTAIGEAAKAAEIQMSIHAPYFISLSGVVPEKRLGSIRYIRDSLAAGELLGAYLTVVHT
jgi:deoxyribonuclease-4